MKLDGWAVESRVYAEDPTRGFLPSTGRLVRYRPPAEGKHDGVTVRNDTGVYEGGEISIYYDPMIAKLVTHAADAARGDRGAGQRARRVLCRGHPPQHPVPVGADAITRAGARGGSRPASSPKSFPTASRRRRRQARRGSIVAAVAAHVDHVMNMRKREISGQLRAPSRLSFDLKRVVALGAARIAVDGRAARRRRRRASSRTARRMRVDSPWTPGAAGLARRHRRRARSAAQVRPILNGFEIAHGGAAVDGARLHARARRNSPR